MAALIQAKVVRGKKIWYAWGARDDEKWERTFPECQTRSAVYDVLRRELEMPSARTTEVVFALMSKTWTGEEWVDDFTIRLRTLRETAALTQAQLAERAGLSPQAIAALEQGTRCPTWDTVQRLARALEVGEEAFKVKLSTDAERVELSGVRTG